MNDENSAKLNYSLSLTRRRRRQIRESNTPTSLGSLQDGLKCFKSGYKIIVAILCSVSVIRDGENAVEGERDRLVTAFIKPEKRRSALNVDALTLRFN